MAKSPKAKPSKVQTDDIPFAVDEVGPALAEQLIDDGDGEFSIEPAAVKMTARELELTNKILALSADIIRWERRYANAVIKVDAFHKLARAIESLDYAAPKQLKL